MEISPQIAAYLLLLLPGFLGHSVFSALTFTAKPTWSGRTVVAVLLSVASYATIQAVRLCGVEWLPNPTEMLNFVEKGGVTAAVSWASLKCVVVACFFAFFYSLLLVAAQNHRTIFRVAQWFGLTTKSGFESEWDSVMHLRARTRWVMVMMKDGTSYTGWLESNDTASDQRGLVLSKVREYDKDGVSFLWPEPELLFVESMSDVRALRLIPEVEQSLEQSQATSLSAPAPVQDRDEIGQHQSEPCAEIASAGIANQTVSPVKPAEQVDSFY